MRSEKPVVARFLPEGLPDSRFGSNGIVICTNACLRGPVKKLLLQPDNSVLALVQTWGEQGPGTAILHLDANGSPLSPDDAKGVQLPLGCEAYEPHDFALTRRGKIVVVGTGRTRDASTGRPTYPLMLCRYDVTGRLDPTLAEMSTLVLPFSGEVTRSHGLVIQADDQILVGGYGAIAAGSSFAVARFNTNGRPDVTFGRGGIAHVSRPFESRSFVAYTIIIQADGRILLAGATHEGPDSSGQWDLRRLNADGTQDTAFASSEPANSPFPWAPQWSRATSLHLDNEGRVIAVGYAVGTLIAMRYQPNGRLDTSFGLDGRMIIGFRAEDGPQMLAIQPERGMVLCGRSLEGGDHLALSRYAGA